MRPVLIQTGRWSVYAVGADDESCELFDFLDRLDPGFTPSVQRFRALIRHIVNDPHGPRNLPDSISHHIEGEIWQLTAGRLRVLWFYDSRHRGVMICTQGFLKKTNKTPRAELERAVEMRRLFLLENWK